MSLHRSAPTASTDRCDENDSSTATEPRVFPVRRFARRPAGLRFSLRTLLIGMVVICLALALLVPMI